MKKKLIYIVSLIFMLVAATGCVKFNVNMDIKKNKSMDFSIIYAIDTSLMGNEELLSEDDKKDLESQGFTIADYNEGNMKGFTVSRYVKNIDKVSSTEDIQYSLSGLLDNESTENSIFKVKKGLLKNTYTAKFDFDATNSDLNEDLEMDQDDTDWNTGEDDWDFDTSYEDDFDDYTTEDSDIDFSQFSNMASSMDLSFNIKLPYAAKSSNATSTNNDNKELKWNLTSDSENQIEFEFELYNMPVIYAAVALIIIVCAIIIFMIYKNKNGNKSPKSGEIQNVNTSTNEQQNMFNSSTENSINNNVVENPVNLNSNVNNSLNTNISNPVTEIKNENTDNKAQSIVIDSNLNTNSGLESTVSQTNAIQNNTMTEQNINPFPQLNTNEQVSSNLSNNEITMNQNSNNVTNNSTNNETTDVDPFNNKGMM